MKTREGERDGRQTDLCLPSSAKCERKTKDSPRAGRQDVRTGGQGERRETRDVGEVRAERGMKGKCSRTLR